MKLCLLVLGILISFHAIAVETAALDVAPVWSAHPVGFALLTAPPHQFVAYYDAERQMTVAQRTLDDSEWTYTQLDEHVGWDSHNYIALALDDSKRLHLAGNMHVHPLRYFRTERALDSSTLTRVSSMVGTLEERMTYPRFFRGPGNEFIFTYRDGSSGSGNQIYNVYDHPTRMWRRLLDQPLVDGQGEMNAYPVGPSKGPDGYFHLVWVWRDTPDCATNHDLSYARSKDLVHWEGGDGSPLALPITFDTADLVDPVPAGGGIINGNTKLGFDIQKRPVIAYHKYDANGITQLYNARLEDGSWKVYLSSDWSYRWAFSGGGSINFEVRIESVRQTAGGLVQGWRHSQHGRQRWRLDPETLRPLEQLPNPKPAMSAVFRTVRSEFPGMQVQTRSDSGGSGEPGLRYHLRWETLDRNRDRPREKPWPPPSMLQVITIQQ
jgi:hypothetical protein